MPDAPFTTPSALLAAAIAVPELATAPTAIPGGSLCALQNCGRPITEGYAVGAITTEATNEFLDTFRGGSGWVCQPCARCFKGTNPQGSNVMQRAWLVFEDGTALDPLISATAEVDAVAAARRAQELLEEAISAKQHAPAVQKARSAVDSARKRVAGVRGRFSWSDAIRDVWRGRDARAVPRACSACDGTGRTASDAALIRFADCPDCKGAGLVTAILPAAASRAGQRLVVIVTTDTKRRLWPAARIGCLGERTPVLFHNTEGKTGNILRASAVLMVDWADLVRCLDLCEEVYSLGFAKRHICESLYAGTKARQVIGVRETARLEQAIMPWRHRPEFLVALLVAQKNPAIQPPAPPAPRPKSTPVCAPPTRREAQRTLFDLEGEG